ncbi:hypothetical protein [Streptomyces globisporus]|uniref:hypothetical protein n=1 Tax=Streptomyces globisporus TaxID=1908 RepID=UPI003690D6ED
MKRRRTVRESASVEPPPGCRVAGDAGRDPPDATQRALILDWVVSRRIASGWRAESRSGSQAVLVRGQPVNHVLHAFLTVFSCLVWGVVRGRYRPGQPRRTGGAHRRRPRARRHGQRGVTNAP